MPWSRDGHVIGFYVQWSHDPDIESSFISNQTSKIFNPKILHASFSAFDLPRHQAPHCCLSQVPRTDSDITSYTSALALSEAEVLRIFQNRCLIAGSRVKTTYRSAPFPSGGGGARDALQWKATRGATSEVVRETAGWTRPDLTLGTSTSASTRPSLCGGGPSSLCGGDGRRSRRNSRWSSGFTQMDPDGWLDVSA